MGAISSKNRVHSELDVGIQDFKVKDIIGKGSFSLVKAAKHKESGRTYALKIIEKKKIRLEKNLVHSVLLEKSILEDLDSPFIGNLRYAFQDAKNVFMVLDLLTGGDLRCHLAEHLFNDSEARYIFAELACGIEYIHQNGVIHRDIKPENIIFDSSGHSHIVDFNVSVRYSNTTELYGAAGSANYMAPEVLKGITYDESVDWWGLGVVTYEMVFGKRPFKGMNKVELLKSINEGPKLEPPENSNISISLNLRNFLSFILEANKESRLGAGPMLKGIERIKKTQWLLNEDWEAISCRSLRPRFTPKYKKNSFYNKKIAFLKKASFYGFVSEERGSLSPSKTEGPSSSNDRHQCAYDVLMASEYRRNSYISDFAPYNYYIKHKQQ